MIKTNLKLPKQWRHWCEYQRLKPHGSVRKGRQNWMYLKGRGYYWRVNIFGEFQLGDTYDEFDRWALCEINEVPMPSSLIQFCSAVERLLMERRGAKPSHT